MDKKGGWYRIPCKRMITIMAFTGKSGSGKSAAAFHLQKTQNVTRLRFAERLKRMCIAMGLSTREIDGDLKKCVSDLLGGKTPQYAMQTLGTEWGRNLIHPDLWVNLLHRDLQYEIRMGRRDFVIDDVRFRNELAYLNNLKSKKDYRVVIVKIIRTGNNLPSLHQSETEMEEFKSDVEIVNDLTLNVLYKNVENIFNLFKKES